MSLALSEGTQFGSYVLERRVAIGGMAEIWSAHRPDRGGRRFAIKVMIETFARDQKLRQMFRDEARIAALLDHPNVVRVEELIEQDGALGHAMELVDGRDVRRILQALIKSGQEMPLGVAVLIAREAARGLAYAHGLCGPDGRPLNVVHRDVSPHNILVDRSGRVRVLDFGVARAEDRLTKTSVGVIKGKLAYMSPEQMVGGEVVTSLADVWSLGVVLWEMLALRRMFAGANDDQIMRRVLSGDLALQGPIRSDVPPALDALVRRMVSARPEDRPRSMLEVETELGQIGRAIGRWFTTEALAGWVAGYLEPAQRKATAMMPVAAPKPESVPPPTASQLVAFDDSVRDADDLAATDRPESFPAPTEAVALPSSAAPTEGLWLDAGAAAPTEAVGVVSRRDVAETMRDPPPDAAPPTRTLLAPSRTPVVSDPPVAATALIEAPLLDEFPTVKPRPRPESLPPTPPMTHLDPRVLAPLAAADPSVVAPKPALALVRSAPVAAAVPGQNVAAPSRAAAATMAWVIGGLVVGVGGIVLFGRACHVL